MYGAGYKYPLSTTWDVWLWFSGKNKKQIGIIIRIWKIYMYAGTL